MFCNLREYILFLADDMGLGKTLTMLSLILKHKELVESGEIIDDFKCIGQRSDENSDSEDEWLTKGKSKYD